MVKKKILIGVIAINLQKPIYAAEGYNSWSNGDHMFIFNLNEMS